MHISHSVSTATGSSNSREADKGGRLLALGAQERGARDVAVVAVAGKGAMSTSSTRMDSSLRDLRMSATNSCSEKCGVPFRDQSE
jgi:hypothetical protein